MQIYFPYANITKANYSAVGIDLCKCSRNRDPV